MVSESIYAIFSLTSNTSVPLVFVTLAVVIYYVINSWQRFETWDKFGVKHVDIEMKSLLTHQIERLMREHGPTVGFLDEAPILVTRDLDLLKQIMVKDFNNFVNRNDRLWTQSLIRDGVFFLKDQHWKRMRRIMSPSFSTGKLKVISAHVREAACRLSDAFEKCARTGSHINLLHTTGQYTSSIIAKTAFGVQADSIGEEEDDQFTYSVKNIFRPFSPLEYLINRLLIRFQQVRIVVAQIFGVYLLDPCPKGTRDYFHAVLEESIAERETAERQGSPFQHNDFLQSLVTTKIASERTNDVSLQTGNKIASSPNGSAHLERGTTSDALRSPISTNEVIAQSIFTILAAYETTASTLQFCLLELARNPDVQEGVFQEIVDVVEHENPTHEELTRLHYMEQAINETLRLFPPLTFISRKASETRTYGSVTIPAGAAINIPIREIHRDPINYPNPQVFDPERFNEENKAKRNPLAFIPFGYGPRLCIGMRLAYLELKEALVHVLRKVKVEVNTTTVPCPGEEVTLDFILFPRPVKPVRLAVKLRENQP